MSRTLLLILFSGILFNSNAQSQESNTWSESVNSLEDLIESYHLEAVHINVQGDVVNGSNAISEFWINQSLESIASNIVFETKAVYRPNIIYKIERFILSDENQQTHLLIEQLENDKSIRKLEFTASKISADIDLSIIDRRRAEWIELCNSKNAEGLVTDLYTENAVYYNHRPVITGREALTQEYQYMNNPRYTLNLTPLHVEIVNDSIIYEIGQCDGSYNGKYVLVWQKGEDGIWRILMDSNI